MNQDHRDFVAIGTAAGVSTAFAAPIGGLLFTIEEGASFYSLATVLWRGFLATCTGIATLSFLVSAFMVCFLSKLLKQISSW